MSRNRSRSRSRHSRSRSLSTASSYSRSSRSSNSLSSARESRSPSRSRSRSRSRPSRHRGRHSRSSSPEKRQIVVTNLTRNCGPEHVKEIFATCGDIVAVQYPYDEAMCCHTGEATITYAKGDMAREAVQRLNMGQIDGQEISVSYWHPPRPPVVPYRSRRHSPAWAHRPYRGVIGRHRPAFPVQSHQSPHRAQRQRHWQRSPSPARRPYRGRDRDRRSYTRSRSLSPRHSRSQRRRRSHSSASDVSSLSSYSSSSRSMSRSPSSRSRSSSANRRSL